MALAFLIQQRQKQVLQEQQLQNFSALCSFLATSISIEDIQTRLATNPNLSLPEPPQKNFLKSEKLNSGFSGGQYELRDGYYYMLFHELTFTRNYKEPNARTESILITTNAKFADHYTSPHNVTINYSDSELNRFVAEYVANRIQNEFLDSVEVTMVDQPDVPAN